MYCPKSIDQFFDTGSFVQALQEEKAVSEKAQTKGGYLSAAVNAIRRLRERKLADIDYYSADRLPAAVSVSHAAVLGGRNAAKHTYTLNRAARAPNAREKDRSISAEQEAFLYENLQQYVLSGDQLDQNGFPRPAAEGSNGAVFRKLEEPGRGLGLVDDDGRLFCVFTDKTVVDGSFQT